MVRELSLISQFEIFIKESLNGKRRKLNGERIKPQTVANYRQVLLLLSSYEHFTGKTLIIKINMGNDRRLIEKERKNWKTFYRHFSDYLFEQKNCFDNYVGSVFKNIKCFFRYLRNEKGLALHEFYEGFYVRKEEIRIITLLPERFCYLITDKNFENKLSSRLRKWKDMFVFGCTVALRFSDLTNLQVRDIEKHNNNYFLYYRSLKTNTPVTVKLPPFAIDIFKFFSKGKKPTAKLFPPISLAQFNRDIKKIARLAGWQEASGKFRNRNGLPVELVKCKQQSSRFCDLITSHVMRRTGITILLMLGMPEYMVRKISGHTAHSESFFRYINFAQSYITDEIDKAYDRLQNLYMDSK